MADFQITTRGMPARAEEWLLAQGTPESELPQLTEEDRRRARIRPMTDEQYARRLLLRAFAKRRESQEAEQIGGIIQNFFIELGGKFKLNAIVKRGFEPGWRALIESHSSGSGWKFFDIPLPTEDFSGNPSKPVLDISNPEEIRAFLLTELDLGEGQRAAS
jgi:hypothetical protein